MSSARGWFCRSPTWRSPGFGIPEAAIGALIWAAVLGFPIAIVFGWFFDINEGGIRRTRSPDSGQAGGSGPLGRSDYAVLTAFVLLTAAWIYDAAQRARTASLAATPAAVEPASTVVTRPKLDNSVAVLPFANISSDPENDYFCDGISEEILNQLSRFTKLNVIGRTSSFAFKNSDVGAASISDALGVHVVLQGSVRKYRAQLRISAQLLDEGGAQVWAKSFDRELRNVLDIQSEIASAVATMVASEISSARRAEHVPPVEAYERFLAGRELLHRRVNVDAERELRRAIEIDPQFAEAYAELGISESMGTWQQSRSKLAREHIDRAIELQPGLLRARAALGLWLQRTAPPDWAESERVLHDVVAQEPNMVDALLWLSTALGQLERTERSLSMLESANRLDPLQPSIAANLASSLLDRDEQDRAFAVMERVFADPTIGYPAFAGIRELMRSTGRLVELLGCGILQFIRLRGPHYWSIALSDGLIQNSDRMQYRLERQSCLEREQAGGLNANDTLHACAENALPGGNPTHALDWPEKAIAAGSCELYILEKDPASRRTCARRWPQADVAA